jgi:dTDP-4-amino-4,6-dideoxy-D-galactose acyltransferase
VSTPTPRVTRLPWDSGVFGFAVARIEPGHAADEPGLAATVTALKRDGVRLAYLALTPRLHDSLGAAAARLGGRAVGERLTYSAVLADRADPGLPPIRVEEFTARAPTAELIDLARQAGVESRFRVDPDVGTAVFHRIYDAWIARSVAREIADAVLVARNDDRVIALVTVSEAAQCSEIGLLAIAPAARGRGIGTALVRATQRRATERGIPLARVVTQGANRQARALYERCGYAVERVEFYYHLWL